MTNAVYTPYDLVHFVELANSPGRFRKQLLPIGTVNYKGRKIAFTRDYLSGLAKAFTDRVFDQVPLQLATAENKHNNDPERTRGKIVSVEMAADGLDIVLEPTEEGAELIRKNPELGVSARIYEHYERSDGKKWPAALQHVLATLDPHITGMRPWQEEASPALSQQATMDVIDLTSATFEKPTVTEDKEEAVTVTSEELAQIISESEAELEAEGTATEAESESETEPVQDEAETESDNDTEDEAELTDEELDELIVAAEALEAAEAKGTAPETEEGEGDNVGNEGGTGTVQASQEQKVALDLANAQIEQQGIELARISAELRQQAFEREKTDFAHRLGIPPHITELARPLLEGDSHVIELAGGDQVDTGKVMRQVLGEIGKQIRVLDLGNLLGNGLPEPDEEREARERSEKETTDFVKAARDQFKL